VLYAGVVVCLLYRAVIIGKLPSMIAVDSTFDGLEVNLLYLWSTKHSFDAYKPLQPFLSIQRIEPMNGLRQIKRIYRAAGPFLY
jgi:hypothetical protein